MRMLGLRAVTATLGVAVLGLAATPSAALTPEEEAILRQEALSLSEQARGLEESAEVSLDQAWEACVIEFQKFVGLEEQAAFKTVGALQRWLQVGDKNRARASELRESSRFLVVEKFESDLLAQTADAQAESERSRAEWQRAAADALLAESQDAETQAVAKELRKRADKDEREAKSFETQAARLRKEADASTVRAEDLIQRAIELESAP